MHIQSDACYANGAQAQVSEMLTGTGGTFRAAQTADGPGHSSPDHAHRVRSRLQVLSLQENARPGRIQG